MLVRVDNTVVEMSVIRTRGPGAKYGAQMRVGGHMRFFLDISGTTEKEAQSDLEYNVDLLRKGNKRIVTIQGRPAFADVPIEEKNMSRKQELEESIRDLDDQIQELELQLEDHRLSIDDQIRELELQREETEIVLDALLSGVSS